MDDLQYFSMISTMNQSAPLPEQAGICLMCACENQQNRLARNLLSSAGALSSTGVIAAVFIADSSERESLLLLARGAIAEQRARCLSEGLFASHRCPDTVRAKTGTEG
jgi:hypothetical protein